MRPSPDRFAALQPDRERVSGAENGDTLPPGNLPT